VKLLFEHLPALEAWLKEEYNDKFVTKVSPHPLAASYCLNISPHSLADGE